MKRIVFCWIAGILISGIACNKNGDNDSASITEIVTNGGWHVSLFSERGNDETSDFSGWNFVFQADGKLIAARGGSTRTGTWSVNSNSSKLLIDLGPKTDTNKPLGELTDDWIIVGNTANKISLTDDNQSREELLEFTKH